MPWFSIKFRARTAQRPLSRLHPGTWVPVPHCPACLNHSHNATIERCSAISTERQRAVEVAASNCPDLALIDLGLDGGLSGIETAEQLRDELDVPVIYLTDGDDALLQRTAASQPYGYVVKPVEARQLNLSIQTALALHEKERRCRESDRALRRTIGELRRKSRIMDTILNSTRDGVVAADGTGRILFANAQAERIVGAVEDMKPADLYDASERQAKHGLFEIDKQTYVPTDQLPLIRALQGKTTDDKEVFVRNNRVPEGAFISTTGRTLWSDDRREIEGGVVFFRDVTRERKAEADLQQTIGKLHDQTRLMQTVFDNMEEGVVVADTAGNFLLTNQRRKHIVGMKLIAAEPVDWPATFGAFHLDKKTHVPTDELPLVRGMRGEATEEVELFIRNERRPDGAYIRARGRPLLDGDGNVIAGVAIFSDITKYKETEAELERTIHDLRTQAQLMETVFESISDGVVVANAEGQFTIFNSSAERIVGLGMMEQAPDRWSQQYGIFHADKTTPFSSDQLPLVHAMQGKSTDDVEMFIRNEKRPDGVYISVNGRPLQKTKEGHSGGVIAFRDVTNRKVAEIELKQAVHDLRNQSELMEATFNGISDGLAIVNTAGELLRVNPVGKQIFGFDSMDPSQARLLIKWGTYYYPDRETLIRPEDLPLNRVIFQGESVSDMDIFVRNQKKPEGFFVRLSARPLLHAEGGIRGGVIIFRDATDQILAEEALTQAFAQGRLEIIDTILHNVGNAINSVTIGIGTLQETLSDNPMLRRLRTLADLLEAHQNDRVD